MSELLPLVCAWLVMLSGGAQRLPGCPQAEGGTGHVSGPAPPPLYVAMPSGGMQRRSSRIHAIIPHSNAFRCRQKFNTALQ